MTSAEIELAVVRYFDARRNMIVPNVTWGFGLNYECDLLMLSASGYVTEIEIKVSRSDLLADKKKRKHRLWESGYSSGKRIIKYFYFAIPDQLESSISDVPERAGVIIVDGHGRCTTVRKPIMNRDARKATDAQRIHLGHLAAMRIWNLKNKLVQHATQKENH